MKKFLLPVGVALLLSACTSTPSTSTTATEPASQPASQAASEPASEPAAVITPAAPAPVVPAVKAPPAPHVNSQEYADFNPGDTGDTNPKDKGIAWVQAIAVTTPAYGSGVKGNTIISFHAPGMTKAQVACWQQPTSSDPSPWGHDANVAPGLALDAAGDGTFTFPADDFPNGPIIVRIFAQDDGKKRDMCQLQLYNTGGVSWNQGIPKNDPPAAAGMKLVFADDFDEPLSVSHDGKNATYESHKKGGGDFSGWQFSDNSATSTPLSQVGTYLRIHASKAPGTKGSSGIISSAHEDGTGVFASAPCYFECRFIAQSAPGTWPAFWLLSELPPNSPKKAPCDELDIIEAYGGLGPKNPNFPNYACTSHYWNQFGPDGKQKHAGHRDVPMMDLGGKSSWSTTFHTYGCKITPTDTIYYFDDMEVLRHPTGEVSAKYPFWFLINYAIGGISGWHIDLERYNNTSDMYVDYVRVYQADK